MSGNELRVTVMARNTYTQHTCIHTHTHTTPTITVENRKHFFFRLDTKQHADGAQEEGGKEQDE